MNLFIFHLIHECLKSELSLECQLSSNCLCESHKQDMIASLIPSHRPIVCSLFVCVLLSAGSLAGGIQSCQRSSRCCSISSRQSSPTPLRTSSTSALETTKSNRRYCLWQKRLWGRQRDEKCQSLLPLMPRSLEKKKYFNKLFRTQTRRKWRIYLARCSALVTLI